MSLPDRPANGHRALCQRSADVPAAVRISAYAPNTGNAIRTCAATGCELHLVERRFGFDLSEPQTATAGLDYHDPGSWSPFMPSLAHAWEALSPARVFAFTAQATTLFTNVGYRAADVLKLGPKPTGLTRPPWLIRTSPGRCAIPMLAGRRSLNLSNAAAIASTRARGQHRLAGGLVATKVTLNQPGRAQRSHRRRRRTGAPNRQTAHRTQNLGDHIDHDPGKIDAGERSVQLPPPSRDTFTGNNGSAGAAVSGGAQRRRWWSMNLPNPTPVGPYCVNTKTN